MANTVRVSGMFGGGKTYFAGSPVVIDISGLYWGNPVTSPFTVVIVEVVYADSVVGTFPIDTGRQTSIRLDISTALRAIWSDYDFALEASAATAAISGPAAGRSASRNMRAYYLRISTEYMASDDGGVFVRTECVDEQGRRDIPGGQCAIGGLTEWERYEIGDSTEGDVAHWEHTGIRFGDASTKPLESPERVGSDSITSWVDTGTGVTTSIFYPPSATPGPDDVAGSASGWNGHAPLVLRDSVPYTDFIFVNRRGAVETCSSPTKAAMAISAETKQYARVGRPSFKPDRSVMAVKRGGRRSWEMSSGHLTREWVEWWAAEFLAAERVWMRYNGAYVPVVVEPAKKNVGIYNQAKQQMSSVEFTVTLALEG